MKALFLKSAMVEISVCRAALGRDEDFVMRLIESGGLKFAFNIAAPKTRRAEVRVLSLSLLDHINGTSSQPSKLDDAIRYATVADVFREVQSRTLSRNWSVSSSHITKLISAGCLALAQSPAHSRAGRLVTLQSARAFLAERRIA